MGPVAGHNVKDLVTILEKIKAMPALGPVLKHVITEKGKGYPPAEAAFDKLHGLKTSADSKLALVHLLSKLN